MAVEISVKISGPLFDGVAEAAITDYKQSLQQRLGDSGVHRVQAHLTAVYEHRPVVRDTSHNTGSTGVYAAGIHTDNSFEDVAVHDTPVVYGPWLEGDGSRNESTRFHGYHTFRIVAAELQLEADAIAEEELIPYIKIMNG